MESPRPSLLRLITRLNIGGPAIQALLLTRALRDDYRTLLAAGNAPTEEGELSDAAVDVVRVPLVRPIRPVSDLSAYRTVSRLIHTSGVRLVHTHMAKAGIIGRLAAHYSPEAVIKVHTFHGHVLEGYFAPPLEKAFITTERWLARRTDALIAVSDEVRDSLLELGIGKPSRFHVIPLGFDLSVFLSVVGPTGALRGQLGLGMDVPLVGVVGRLAAIKDHGTLLRAMTQVPDAHLAILGDGDKRADVEREIARLGLVSRVHIVGWRLDIADCLADMDVIALSSRNEGTPVSLIEASACARPVVATDVGGVRSVVIDGKTGLLASAGDATGIAAHLRTMIDHPGMAARFGKAGREHVRNRFDHRRLITDVQDLYSSLFRSSH